MRNLILLITLSLVCTLQAQDIESQIKANAEARAAKERNAAAAQAEAARQEKQKAADAQQSAVAKAKAEAAAEAARPWRHLPLDVAAKKYGAKIDKTRVFPDCKKLGTSEPKRGDLFVGSLTIIDISPYETLPTAKITYRHSSGLTFVMFVPKKYLTDVCVGGVDIARAWCPIRIVMPAKGKYAAEIVPHAGYLDSPGLK